MAKPLIMTKAIAYLRTSSAANVGADKDSDKRQRAAIGAFAKRVGLEITEEFYDQDVSGADPIESRPGFSALLDRIESNGVRTVVVEDASRFARQLIVQEAGIIALIERGVRVLTSSGDDLTETSDPFKIAMRQIAGVFAQLEKARLVSKLKAARDRKRSTGVKVEGRKSYAEIDKRDHDGRMITLVRRLRRKAPKKGRRSLREISAELARAGFLSSSGKPYAATAVARMLGEL
ncbi:DNA invertase Pin-like site-specific DNA recombinase [Bradyrhizobium sp. USDA 4524]|uniref:recombinase family protein n=1 Tax=unclassified Bradyrhizobium TaxID=2631580 RepID=UPI0020A0B63F|nr:MULTISPECIES: recombinase family protein [unclassified Bradyrhizobium]MCP1840436.1 DNA invertase Pin-like site-specific DNA recombinase [Bradyrhizobium sp. USDA 4538]MCP1901000.1 DNA invertase Pin-like site-specific DNA recombinase [Bradyrhizobium sp. USDA 4537]MCP1993345.1 DNA invertase Pin-like site-specific DNA recombinase [Bradyrhizobium sp. USDA 4539]